jgi:sugar (pentulose or hexulose) kinase
VLGVGDASGMFPIDSKTNDYDAGKIELFNERLEAENIAWKLQDILPKVLLAGDAAGVLTAEGAKLLDPTGQLQTGIPLCPPEGDAVQAWSRLTALQSERATFPLEHLSLL